MTASTTRHLRRLLAGLVSAVVLTLAAGAAGVGAGAANAYVPSSKDGVLWVVFDYSEVQAVYYDSTRADEYCSQIAISGPDYGTDIQEDLCASFLRDCVAQASNYTLEIKFDPSQYVCYRIG